MSESVDRNANQPFFYLALSLLSFSLLASEILLTRILSVVFWYHFVFLVVSIVMFGLTVGGILVYVLPGFFLKELTKEHLSLFSYLSGLACVLGLLSLFYLPIIFYQFRVYFLLMPVLYLLLAVQFITTGICLSLALSRFPFQVNKLYSANLIGSALGCVGIILILKNLNAPSAVFLIASITCLSAFFFSANTRTAPSLRRVFILTFAVLIAVSGINAGKNSIHPKWAKDFPRGVPLYQKWNFFSYVTVGSPSKRPFGWGYSSKINDLQIKTDELMILIDEGAGTVLTKFDSVEELEYLKFDVSSIAYYLRNNEDVLVIGSGGGRDLLTASIFGAKRAVGVEINEDVVDAAFNKFGGFSSGIRKFPQIEVVVSEGRSYISRSDKKYNIIQASMVDSFAAAASGTFALSENSLYTTQAWVIFLDHLKDNGILTFSRWYFEEPYEIYRLLTLAKTSLEKTGISDLRSHIVLVRNKPEDGGWDIGTLLVSKSPFTDSELDRLAKVCDRLNFEIVLSRDILKDPIVGKILSNKGREFKITEVKANINPSTDNKPFYFYFSTLRDLFRLQIENAGAKVLQQSLLMIFIFSLLFILIPLKFRPESFGLADLSAKMAVYFGAIGMAFMFVEIPLIQRLGMFLGHPVYGFVVVLFSLLLACGIGSYLTRFLTSRTRIYLSFSSLLILIFFLTVLVPHILIFFTPAALAVKILISILIAGLPGLLMGMPFPLAMRLENSESSPRVLYWSINGFTSVCASALALVVLIHFGFQATLLTGFCFYFIALASLSRRLRLLNPDSLKALS